MGTKTYRTYRSNSTCIPHSSPLPPCGDTRIRSCTAKTNFNFIWKQTRPCYLILSPLPSIHLLPWRAISGTRELPSFRVQAAIQPQLATKYVASERKKRQQMLHSNHWFWAVQTFEPTADSWICNYIPVGYYLTTLRRTFSMQANQSITDSSVRPLACHLWCLILQNLSVTLHGLWTRAMDTAQR